VRLGFHVSRIAGSACTPLNGAVVDVWQCDALGMYSDVQDINGLFDTRGKSSCAAIRWRTPVGRPVHHDLSGWYPGRTVHIHFKIRTDPRPTGLEFTSQLYFDEAINDQVHCAGPICHQGAAPPEERQRLHLPEWWQAN